jgi:DNA-binding LacI/PurR family transcriptional regulator
VDVDGARGTSEAVNHLASLGHTRIGFLGLGEGNGVGDDRYHGWQRAMDDLGLPVRGLVARAEDGIATGKALAEQMMNGPNPPTAFVCISDAMAVGALDAIEELGMRAGHDVSVVGFDDSPVASVIRPRLSSLRQPVEGVAHKLVEVLLAELAGTQRRPSRVLLAPWLVRRESTGDCAPPKSAPTHKPPAGPGRARRQRTSPST